jgi:uncharacterized paraquat-inducible protein A
MESILKPCPYCEHTVEIPPVRENTTLSCPHCGKTMDVFFDFEQNEAFEDVPVWDIKKLSE